MAEANSVKFSSVASPNNIEMGVSNASATPPSYESLNFVDKLKKAKEESSNPGHYVMKSCADNFMKTTTWSSNLIPIFF